MMSCIQSVLCAGVGLCYVQFYVLNLLATLKRHNATNIYIYMYIYIHMYTYIHIYVCTCGCVWLPGSCVLRWTAAGALAFRASFANQTPLLKKTCFKGTYIQAKEEPY